jgi:transcriptional regulator with XRE-family HTH domain
MSDIREAGRLIQTARERAGLTQRELARLAGTSQPAIASLERTASNPTVETLARCATAAGFALSVQLVPLAAADPVVKRYARDVDRTLLRENLRKSVNERVRTLGEWQEAGRELQRATLEARRRR